MAISKQPDGTWKLDMRVDGRDSRRIRKSFTTKAEALGYERYILKEVDDKPWLGIATQDNRSLGEIMQRWHDLHGQQLTDEIPLSRGPLFSSCRKAFAQAIKRTKLTFPESQMTHILRHTFASHFMMNGGNILVLKQILGHADIKETMRYAHFAPEHLDDAITKNPLANLNV